MPTILLAAEQLELDARHYLFRWGWPAGRRAVGSLGLFLVGVRLPVAINIILTRVAE